MTAATHRQPRSWRSSDEGRIALLVLVLAFGVLSVIGLAVDGGGKMRAIARADYLASEAARAAGQAIQAGQAIEGGAKVVDPTTAVAAAQNYLANAGVAGTVSIAGDRRHVTVTVRIVYNTKFAAILGITELPVTRTATAALLTG